jgi:hypothetical protein
MLDQQLHHKDIGEALEWSLHDSWHVWKRQHAPGLSTELAWTERVKKIHTEVDTLHAGRVRIRVTVEAQKPWQTEVYWYAFFHATPEKLLLQAKV